MSAKDKRTGWRCDLKVGDTVIVSSERGEQSLGKIEKITPSGKMDVRGRRYEPDGFNRSGFSWASLEEPTTEALAQVRNQQAAKRARQRIWTAYRKQDRITPENAEAVNAALDKLAEAMGVTL